MSFPVKFKESTQTFNTKFKESKQTFNANFEDITPITHYVGGERYEGTYEVTPTVDAQTLPTAQKVMEEDVVVHKIPYYEVSNNTGGTTVTIGNEV